MNNNDDLGLLDRKIRDCDEFLKYIKESKEFNVNTNSAIITALSNVWSRTK